MRTCVLAPDPTQGDHPGYATAFTRFTACAPQREVVYAVDADGQFSAARAWEALRRFARAVERGAPDLDEPVPVGVPPIDYAALFARDRERAHAGKRRAMWRSG